MEFLGSALAIAAIAVGVLGGPLYLLIVAISLMNFGSLAVLPPEITGGISITAAPAAFAVLFVLVLLTLGGRPLSKAAFDPARLGFLTLFTISAVATTIVMPNLFSGLIYTYPIRATGLSSYPVAVTPTASNFTQAGYLILSYLTALSVSAASTLPSLEKQVGKAYIVLAALLVLSGILDLAGLGDILSVFRNASYALVGDSSIGGATKRVVGAMPEASSYGSTCASVFAILLLRRSHYRLSTRWLACTLGTGALAVLSTSSTAYGMLGVSAACLALQLALEFLFGDAARIQRATVELSALLLGALLLSVFVLANEDIRSVAERLVDELILRKSLSSSFEERTRWTMTALNAFYDSYGLGIGLGSARSSNTFVNLLASSGAIPSLFFILYIVRLFFFRSSGLSFFSAIGSRLSLLPIATGLSLAGTTPDYGVGAAILFGLLSPLGTPSEKTKSQGPALSAEPNLSVQASQRDH